MIYLLDSALLEPSLYLSLCVRCPLVIRLGSFLSLCVRYLLVICLLDSTLPEPSLYLLLCARRTLVVYLLDSDLFRFIRFHRWIYTYHYASGVCYLFIYLFMWLVNFSLKSFTRYSFDSILFILHVYHG